MAPVAGSKAIKREREGLTPSARTRTASDVSTGLAPTATSHAKGAISLRQSNRPSKSSAANSDEPNSAYTRLPSVQGVGAAYPPRKSESRQGPRGTLTSQSDLPSTVA